MVSAYIIGEDDEKVKDILYKNNIGLVNCGNQSIDSANYADFIFIVLPKNAFKAKFADLNSSTQLKISFVLKQLKKPIYLIYHRRVDNSYQIYDTFVRDAEISGNSLHTNVVLQKVKVLIEEKEKDAKALKEHSVVAYQGIAIDPFSDQTSYLQEIADTAKYYNCKVVEEKPKSKGLFEQIPLGKYKSWNTVFYGDRPKKYLLL